MQFKYPDKAITKSPTLQAHINARPAQPKYYFWRIAKESKCLCQTKFILISRTSKRG